MRRDFYIDKIRIGLTALVILHHTAIAYGASGGWCYITPEIVTGWKQLAMSSMLAVNQAFFMSLFFFISAYFTPVSHDKKGFRKYLVDRLIRLGVPLVVYCTVLNPTLLYLIGLHTNRINVSWFEYLLDQNLRNPNTSHLWFLFALLVFEFLYALYRRVSKKSISAIFSDTFPSNQKIFLFVLVCGIVAFLLRTGYPIGGKNIIGLQLGYFTLYTAFYLLGIIARRKNWLDKMPFAESKKWFTAALIAAPLVLAIWVLISRQVLTVENFVGGWQFESAFLAFWEALLCVGISFFVLAASKKYLNNQGKMTLALSSDSYAAYVFHPYIVVGITIASETIAAPPFLKFISVSVAGIILCFLTAHWLKKIQGFNYFF